MQTILIFGATSSIAQACMQVWAQTGQVHQFICVARNYEKLASFTRDFIIRYPKVQIESHILDFQEPVAIHSMLEKCFSQKIDQALLAQGMMFNDESILGSQAIEELIQVNATSITIALSEIYHYMNQQGNGKIGIIGSVAGDRGRKANYLYGASKAFIATYVEGLQHRAALESSAVSVSLIKPGPTQSAMTQRLMAEGKRLAKVEDVAQQIVAGMQLGKRTIYTPKIWRIIMLVICHLPFSIFKRMDI